MIYSVWAGVKFLGVFSSESLARSVYEDYQMAIGARDCGDMIVFPSVLDELYEG